MTLRSRVWLTLLGILVLAVGAGIVGFPKGPSLKLGGFERSLNLQLGLDLQGGAQLTYEADVSNLPPDDRESALAGTRDVIERRVNAFGVSEPVVQTSRVGESDRVIVELPGVTDLAAAVARIGETPLLEFREEAPPVEITDEQRSEIDASRTEARGKAQTVLGRVLAGEDFAALANEFSEDPGNTDADGAKKGGDLGFSDPAAYVTPFADALSALADGAVTQALVETDFGFHIIKREESRTSTDSAGAEVTEVRARHILFSALSEAALQASQPQYVNTGLSGQHLQRAQVLFGQTLGEPQVELTFNDEGKKLFSEITERNVGKSVAIYLDGYPISTPVVQEKIDAGQAVINGSFTLEQAKDLASNLNAGALPVPVTLIAQQQIGASLGRASVERSFVAGLIGFALVALFMVLYYRFPGLLAVVALIVYALLTLAVFKLWPITLTLAGIAGFILSIGMAVDANVLIFERMKEELRGGRPLAVAVEQGFSRAWPSIRDSNVSSIISCVILAWFGTSLVQGFAITLAIGILVSMFSAITVSRTLLRLFGGKWLERHGVLLGTRPATPQP